MSHKWSNGLFACLLAAVVLVLYGPSVRFGLIWDDPTWYQQGAGQSPWQIFTALPSYQFYRPLAILLNRQFVSENGIVNVPLAHAIQIMAHLIAVWACAPVLQAFAFQRWHARLTALLFAISPFAFQAVAWQAPQQPLAVMWLLLALLAADRFTANGRAGWLGFSLLAYVAALFFQESALPFVFLFVGLSVLRQTSQPRRRRWWPVLHLGLAAVYALIWLNVPRRENVTGQGFQPMVLAYLLQGTVFPFAHWTTNTVSGLPLLALIGIFSVAALVLALGAWKWTSVRSALWTCMWIAMGLLPAWAGLAWIYVETSPRVLYPASVGIAGLWAALGAWALSREQPRWRRVSGGLAYILVLVVSLQQWWQFQRLYEAGTQHLAQAVDVLSASPDQRLLFVNFPDRIELKPKLYPLGFWGITLAPIVQHLSDYALAQGGRSGRDQSVAAFLIGADERDRWPYRVDMRGEDFPPDMLYQAALEADAIYLTQYRLNGALGLEHVGSVRPVRSSQTIAMLGDSARLAEAKADVSTSRMLTLRLVWDSLKPFREHDTIFVHFWHDGTFVGNADGDSLGGLVSLLSWKPGTEIVDVRQVDVSRFPPGRYQVRVGIYNRLDNARYIARGLDGRRFADDEALAATFRVQ